MKNNFTFQVILINATLVYIKIDQEIQTDLLTVQAWWYTFLQALCRFFQQKYELELNSRRLDIIWIFLLVCKEASERATDCFNGAFQPCLRNTSSCKAFS